MHFSFTLSIDSASYLLWQYFVNPQDDMYALDESVEFGDVMDSQMQLRHRSTSQNSASQLDPQSHPPAHPTTSAPVISTSSSSSSSYPYISEEVVGGHRTPPPPYDAVIEPDENTFASYGFTSQSTLVDELRHKETGPKGSSTPLLMDSNR